MGSGASKKPAAERSVSAPPEVNAERRHTISPRTQTSQSAQDFRRRSTPSAPPNPGTSNETNYQVTRDYTIEGVGYVVSNEGGPPVVLGFRPEGTSQVTSISRIQESGQYELEMDTSRDLTLSRILSADEFLARMSETDQRISNFAAVSDQDQVYDQLKDLMGLRGHLQDEILRIQAMMSQDDPNLHAFGTGRGLEEFAHIYPHVVARIRELAARAKVIEAVATGDTPTSSRGSGVSALSHNSNQDGVQLDPTIVQTIQHQVIKSQSESNTINGVSIGVNTSQELKEKHDLEERQVAAEYAKRLAAGGRNIPPGAREMILDQHLASMQALRTKQDQERKLFEITHQKVPKKPVAKVTAMPSAKDSDNESEDSSHPEDESILQNGVKEPATSFTNTSQTTDELTQTSFTNSNEDSATQTSVKATELSTQTSVKANELSTQTSLTNTNGETTDTQTSLKFGQLPKLTTRSLVADNTSTQTSLKFDELLKPTSSTNEYFEDSNENFDTDSLNYNNLSKNSSLDYLLSSKIHDNVCVVRPRGLFDSDPNEDRNFDSSDENSVLSFGNSMKNSIGTKMNQQLDPNDIQNILDNFRNSESKRKDLKNSEQDKLQMALDAKLLKRGHQNVGSDSELDLNSDDSDDEELLDKDQAFIKKLKKKKKISQKELDSLLAEHLATTAALRQQRKNAATRSDELLKQKLKSRSQGEEFQEDEETSEELKNLDENLRKNLAARRKDMSEAELQAMLASYRKDRQQLLNKRGSEKAKHDDLLQRKLEENKRRRASLLVSRENGDATAEDLEHMDDKFFQELQRKLKSGEISQETFSSMLKNYLNTIDSNQLKQKRLEQRKMREKKKDEDARNEASNLVHESLELKRQITSIRNREREAFDEQLRNKLAQKGKMSPLVE